MLICGILFIWRRGNKPNFGYERTINYFNESLEHFQSGRMHEAEKLAVSITNEFPNHQYAWKVLGAVFGVTGRKSEAEDVNRKAVALSPDDAAAHGNLGITLRELGKLNDARRQATDKR